MLLCPISPHLVHPHSLCCSAQSQAASSFWSQQQCYSINPLAGYATVYKRCCFPSYKSLNIASVLLPMTQPGTQSTSSSLCCLPSTVGPAYSLPCRRKVEPKCWCLGARMRWICISDCKSYISEIEKPSTETKALSPFLLGGCKFSVFNKVIPDL